MRLLAPFFVIGLMPACGAGFDDFGPGSASERSVEPPGDAEVVARGVLVGAAGHQGSGTVTIERVAGEVVLVLHDDVSFSGVPGPVAVLSDRASIGTALAPGDARIAAIPGTRGPFAYTLLESDLGRSGFWVWCEPFGVDVAYAALEAP